MYYVIPKETLVPFEISDMCFGTRGMCFVTGITVDGEYCGMDGTEP
jgi:hypothetical protein